MRSWRLSLVIAALAAGGCAASAGDSGSSGTGDVFSGQTGSLIPSCGAVPALLDVQPVPSGDTAFVLHTSECRTALAPGGFRILDATGGEVEIAFESVDGGALLARTAEVLPPGSYTIVTPDETVPFDVTEPEPLPVRLGELRAVTDQGCGATLELVLDEAALPYTSLLRLDVSVDGGAPEPWFDHGMLNVEDGVALLRLERCEPVCFRSGSHEITLHASIAGESAAPDPVSVDVTVDCDEDSGGGCAVTAGDSSGQLATWPLALVFGIAALRRRRR